MFEIVFELSSLADTAVFYGINNSNMQLIKNLHPNLRIVARGNVIKIIGNQQEADKLIVNLQKLEKFSIDNNRHTETNIIELIKAKSKQISYQN
jgi:phosphate starvation-inducible PhoH-like protein